MRNGKSGRSKTNVKEMNENENENENENRAIVEGGWERLRWWRENDRE